MNVDREIVIDLLPVYFSGEASSQTAALVETHFRQDPEFERLARQGAGSLDALRDVAVSMNADKEKKELDKAKAAARYRIMMRNLLIVAAMYSLLSLLLMAIEHFHFTLKNSHVLNTGAALSICALAMWFTYGFCYLRQRSVK
ncbi:MAG: hypothetical protein WCB53_18400 [Terriglobales bacterium]